MEIQRNRNRVLIAISVLFVLAVLVTGGTLGYFWYQKAHQQPDSSSSSGGSSISLDTSQKLETEAIQTAMVVPKSTDKVGDSINVSVFSITTPKSWRTLNGRTIINTPLQSVYAESASDILAQLIMVPEQNPSDQILASNSFSLYNVTSWLKQPSMGATGQVTPAVKTAYMNNIQSLSTGAVIDKTVCAKGNGILNTAICGNLLKPTPITTQDGSLKGIAFLGTGSTQTVSYAPEAFVMLTGQIKDQQVFAYGDFHLLDNQSHQLDIKDTAGIKAAWSAFASGNVPSDTMQLYQHVIDAVKSITIQP